MSRQEHYENEKMALDDRFGSIDGRLIKVDLSILKSICPRPHAQSRSYLGLSNYLYRVYDVTMMITTQKQSINNLKTNNYE